MSSGLPPPAPLPPEPSAAMAASVERSEIVTWRPQASRNAPARSPCTARAAETASSGPSSVAALSPRLASRRSLNTARSRRLPVAMRLTSAHIAAMSRGMARATPDWARGSSRVPVLAATPAAPFAPGSLARTSRGTSARDGTTRDVLSRGRFSAARATPDGVRVTAAGVSRVEIEVLDSSGGAAGSPASAVSVFLRRPPGVPSG